MFDIATTSIKFNASIIGDNKDDSDQEKLWNKLNFSQQFSVCSLGQFGYVLTYVRHINNRSLAILRLEDKVATINEDGLINVSPKFDFKAK